MASRPSIEETLLEHRDLKQVEDFYDSPHGRKKSDRTIRACHWVLHISSIFLIITILIYSQKVEERSKEICMLKHDSWSPALESLDESFETQTYDGTFLGHTPYKGPPTDAVNAAWKQLWDVNTVNLTAATMLKLGRSLDSVQYPSETGGGYMAQLAAAHQLHCLHMVWRDHHLEYFPVELAARSKRPGFYEAHYEHCVDMIRQRIMCTADTGLITFRWIEGKKGPEPDFNTVHQCRSFEATMDWTRGFEANVPVDEIRWRKPNDAVMLPEPP